MKFAEEVWTYFLGKLAQERWPTKETPKVLFTLAINFSMLQGESTSCVLNPQSIQNTWVVSGEARLESSGLIAIFCLVTSRMRKADKVPCCQKIKLLNFCHKYFATKYVYRILTRLVLSFHPALMSGCGGKTFDDICYIWLWLSALHYESSGGHHPQHF